MTNVKNQFKELSTVDHSTLIPRKNGAKEAIQDFKDSLDKVDLLMYNTDEELLTSSMSDWWGCFQRIYS